MDQKIRTPGISFIVRARNEEQHLRQCLESLQPLLTIPHEIIVNLHLCTDHSRDIAEECKAAGQPILIYDEVHPVARAGYENLATPVTAPNSMASLTNRCFARASYNWLFKWDADFVASPALLSYLQTELKLDERNPIRYKIPCHVGDQVNVENYLFNCLDRYFVGVIMIGTRYVNPIFRYTKFVFWEVPNFCVGAQQVQLTATPIWTLPYTVLKEYWKEPRCLDADSESRYQQLVALFGPEPVGAARAQCPDLDRMYGELRRDTQRWERLGIHLYT